MWSSSPLTFHNHITILNAIDPLFYLHHANLDRIWWNWQQMLPSRLSDISGRSTTTAPFQNVTLDFGLEMGNLSTIVPIRDVMNIHQQPSCYAYVWYWNSLVWQKIVDIEFNLLNLDPFFNNWRVNDKRKVESYESEDCKWWWDATCQHDISKKGDGGTSEIPRLAQYLRPPTTTDSWMLKRRLIAWQRETKVHPTNTSSFGNDKNVVESEGSN